MAKKKDRLVVISGAGISAESGIKTFRDADGLWEGHDVMTVASPKGWAENMDLVLDFYNQRRAQLHSVEPNAGHFALVELEQYFDTVVITQNVDNLHERAGNSQVLHLHGELLKARSSLVDDHVVSWLNEIKRGDVAADGSQLRPHIVWFGEPVPMIEQAIDVIQTAAKVLIVGTSMQVYPAASLVAYAPRGAEIFYLDPRPTISYELAQIPSLKIIEATAANGLPDLVKEITDGL